MSPIAFAIKKPVTVLVGVILVVLFGILAAISLPVQLTPNVDRPIITVATRWEGASPREVERAILHEQEDKLKGIPGLKHMTSTAQRGSASVELEFQVGMDSTRALLDVNDRLRQVPSYPENVDKPVVTAGETGGSRAIAWFILEVLPGSGKDPKELPLQGTLLEKRVKPILERAQGVSSVGVVGAREREVHVELDPVRLASRSLSLLDVRRAIRMRNLDVSAGTLEVGKRSFTVRTAGKFKTLRDMARLVLARRAGHLVRLEDVGRVRLGFKEAQTIVRSFGQPAVAINAQREGGSNVLEVMKHLRVAVAQANQEVLLSKGMRLIQVHDQTDYIYSAIGLVRQNLYVGGLLAMLVLLLFLRSGRSTLVVALAMPVSVIGSFLALKALGRNLNVVSLAGLAFAIGMVVDNSIVVLENIYRHRQMGKPAMQAAGDGAREVWGAVLASTLTTLAVFLPVVFLQDETGQLFRDIAIAISASVALSLLISVFFIPMAAGRLVQRGSRASAAAGGSLLDKLLLGPPARLFVDGVAGLVAWLNRSVLRRIVTVVGITGAALVASDLALPPMAYLPGGNQNLVIGFLIPPPGYNTQELERMGETVEAALKPYWSAKAGARLPKKLGFPSWYHGREPIPAINNFFYVAFGQTIFMGARSRDDQNVKPLEQLLQHASSRLPGVLSFATQTSLFERGVTAGNSIDLEVTGDNMQTVRRGAGILFGAIMKKLGPPRPQPANFNLGAPEIRVRVDGVRAAEVGLSPSDVGFMVQASVDGAVVSDYEYQGDVIDIKLMPLGGVSRVQSLEDLPIFTSAGLRVPLSSIAKLKQTTAPGEILHLEQRRGVKLVITPKRGMELSRAMEILQEQILAPLEAQGVLPRELTTHLAGTADKLVSTRKALQTNFLLAVIITYLLLAALFESFLYPLVIMVSVPLAGVGGILGLRLVHMASGQQMDVLTMLGFVILVGTVVNNAILIVHYALGLIREQGVDPETAIVRSVRTRVRPIFMSTGTSVLGMLPLVLFPGAGSELYRGLGSVVVGGLMASTLFTLIVTPTLFSLFLGGQRTFANLMRSKTGRGPHPRPQPQLEESLPARAQREVPL